MALQDPKQIVYGYHGTSAENASDILSRGFVVSRNPYDWLGDGIYFFEAAPERAREWAENRYADPAVIVAEIDLIDCMDLLDIQWAHVLADAYNEYIRHLKTDGTIMPHQTSGAHRLDREVINFAIGLLEESGMVIHSVRGAFSEGNPVYPDSAIFDRSHVQIAVRDPDKCVKRIWLDV